MEGCAPQEEDLTVSKEGEAAMEVSAVLTEEEKANQLKRAEERIKQRKLEIQEEERKREIEREKARRRDGQDLARIKADIEWREAQKIAQEKKREKREDRLARQRVLEEIARDRENMKAKHSKASAEHGSSNVVSEKDERQRIKDEIARDRENVRAQKELDRRAATSSGHTHEQPPPVKKDYNEARLQIRLPSNTKLIQTFGADEPLSAVRVYVDVNSQGELGPFIDLSTPYPRKIFTDDEMLMSLRVLGLTPNAVLLATKGKDPGSGTAI